MFDSETKLFIFEMLIGHKTESIEMPVQGGDAMESIALTMALDASISED